MPSFSIALTGLEADSVALSTIGNNLANLNTTAFKEQTVSFSDLFYRSIGTSGANAPIQVGLGTSVSSIDTDFTQGSLSTTGNTADMALNGNGFFVVKENGNTDLTRAGDFSLSSTGDLITSGGATVQGYPVVNGAVDTDAPLTTINIPTSSTQLPNATQNFSMTANLDASAATGTTFNATTEMYDSLGTEHAVDVTFTKTATNTWGYAVTMPAGDAATTSGNTGTLTFNSDGSLASPTGSISGITFGSLSDSASDMTLNWNLQDSTGKSTITESASTSATNSITQDGYASGTYESFAVDTSGVVTAKFTNGGTEVLGQVAVATVANEEALTRSGDNLYATSNASGGMNLGTAGTGDRGTIQDSSLEQSNIDISTEFANLIVAQRAFEANSKTVTAFDTITQDTINMIR